MAQERIIKARTGFNLAKYLRLRSAQSAGVSGGLIEKLIKQATNEALRGAAKPSTLLPVAVLERRPSVHQGRRAALLQPAVDSQGQRKRAREEEEAKLQSRLQQLQREREEEERSLK
jgi:hypothetical protein